MVVVAVRLLSMFVVSYGGYRISVLLNDNYILKTPQQTLAIIVGIILGLLIGFVVGGSLGRFTANILGDIEAFFYKVSAADIVFSAAGALVGLLIALIPSIALFQFSYIGYVLSVALMLVFGFAGARTGAIKRSEISSLFKGGGSMAAAGGRSMILDTSVIIDGRIVDIAKAGFINGVLVVPRFVLAELQAIADSADTLKRSRGRRGLDILNALQRLDNVRIEITDEDFPEIMGVDAKLTALSKATGMPLTTNDFNLNKVAEIQGVGILNINELASALKPVVLPGEEMRIKIIREGKEPGQGVGYLDDGTMVVVEHAKRKVGEEVTIVATSVLQTSAGKMIFSELKDERMDS